MKLVRALERVARGLHEPAELRRVGESLGDELPRRRLDLLRSFRAGLAHQHTEGSPFAEGYVAALTDVLAGFEAAIRDDVEVEQVREDLLRSNWRDVLASLRNGATLPGDIARQTGLSKSRVSRVLDELREAELAEQYSPAPHEDGRTRPHRLTARGERVTLRLPSPVPDTLLQGVGLAVELFCKLLRGGVRSREQVIDAARSAVGESAAASGAAEAFIAAAERERILCRDGDQLRPIGVIAPTPICVEHLVLQALQDNQSTLLRQLAVLRLEGHALIVRTASPRSTAWTTLQNWSRDPEFRTLSHPSLELEHAEKTPRYALFCDDASLARDDVSDGRMRLFVDKAARRVCVAATGEDVPAPFERLALEQMVV